MQQRLESRISPKGGPEILPDCCTWVLPIHTAASTPPNATRNLVNPIFEKLVITNAWLAGFLQSVLIESLPSGLREAQDSHFRLRDATGLPAWHWDRDCLTYHTSVQWSGVAGSGFHLRN